MSPDKDQKKIFTLPITTMQDEIDELGHVNNVVYLRYVQDAAQAHWNAVAPASLRQQFFWIVLRHEIDYFKPAFLGNNLMARTWVSSFEGVKSVRHVEILFNENRLSSATTLWCLMDRKTKRPTRIREEILSVFK